MSLNKIVFKLMKLKMKFEKTIANKMIVNDNCTIEMFAKKQIVSFNDETKTKIAQTIKSTKIL